MHRLFAVLACFAAVACRAPETDPLRVQLEDGITIADHIGTGGGDAIVLVLDPSECFDCTNVIWEWREWSRANRGKLLVLLSRQPTDLERKNFVARRFLHDGVVNRTDARAMGTPSEFLVREGRLVYESRGSVGVLTQAVVESTGVPLEMLVDRLAARASGGRGQNVRVSREGPQLSTERGTP